MCLSPLVPDLIRSLTSASAFSADHPEPLSLPKPDWEPISLISLSFFFFPFWITAPFRVNPNQPEHFSGTSFLIRCKGSSASNQVWAKLETWECERRDSRSRRKRPLLRGPSPFTRIRGLSLQAPLTLNWYARASVGVHVELSVLLRLTAHW